MDDQVACVEAAVRTYQHRLIGLAFSILRRLEPARDEVQNTFLRLAQTSCPSIANKEAWLVTVCRRAALKAAARQRTTTQLSAVAWESLPDESAPPSSEAAEMSERVRWLLDQLDTLPEKQREVLRLHYFAGLKPAQIAEVLGDRPNNIYQLHFAGLASLRKRSALEPPS